MPFNTGNPVGSIDPRDLLDNTVNLDQFATGTQATHPDRRGVVRKTLAGMQAEHDTAQVERAGEFDTAQTARASAFDTDQTSRANAFDTAQTDRAGRFDTFLAGSAYQFLGDYAAGIEVTARNQVIRSTGEYWRVSAQLALPYTTTGAGMPEADAFVPVGDAVLRQDLADPAQGAAKIARGVVAVDSIADLIALPAGQRKADLRYIVKGYHAGSDSGCGAFYWYSTSEEPEIAGMILTPGGHSGAGRFKRKLRSGVISPRMCGAKFDGITDDGPSVRSAMAMLIKIGGGVLDFDGKGECFINSGDPRGLLVNGQYYTACEAGDNITVTTSGSAKVLLNPNRIGMIAGKNDAGLLFGNFRVRSADNISYAVDNFKLINFRAKFQPMIDQSVTCIDGQILRLRSDEGTISNGKVAVKDCTVENAPGSQCVSVEEAEEYIGRDNTIINPGNAINAGQKDHSAFYVSGKHVEHRGNRLKCDTYAGLVTFIETRGEVNIVEKNRAKNCGIFCNAVSNPWYDGAVRPQSFYLHKNRAIDVREFVRDYAYIGPKKELLETYKNKVVLVGKGDLVDESFIRFSNDSSQSYETVTAADRVILRGDQIKVRDEFGGVVSTLSTAGSVIRDIAARDLEVHDLTVEGARQAVARLTDTVLRKVRLIGGSLSGCTRGSDSSMTSRTPVYLNTVPGGVLQQFEMIGVALENKYAGPSASHGLYWAMFHTGTLSCAIKLVNNQASGNTDRDIWYEQGTDAALPPKSVHVEHVSTYSPSPSLGAALPTFGTTNNMTPHSVIRLPGGALLRTHKAGVGVGYIVEDFDEAIPTTGFWPRGSRRRHPFPVAGGVAEWIAVEAGTPGVWKAFSTVPA